MKLSDLTDHDTLSAQRRATDPEYAAESDRLAAASELSTIIVDYRAQRGISQTELGRQLGWKQPQVARLESGEHLPNLATLRTLAQHKIIKVVVDGAGISMKRPAPGKRSASKKTTGKDRHIGVTSSAAAGKKVAARRTSSTKTGRSQPAAAAVKSRRG